MSNIYYESLRYTINYLIADKQNSSNNFEEEEAKLNAALRIILSKGRNEDAPVSLAAVYGSSFDVNSPTLAHDIFSDTRRKENVLDLLLFQFTKRVSESVYISLSESYAIMETQEDVQLELIEQLRERIDQGKLNKISKAYLRNACFYYYTHLEEHYTTQSRGNGEVTVELNKTITLNDGNEVPLMDTVLDPNAEVDFEKLFYNESIQEMDEFLSDRELKVFSLSQAGYSNTEIATVMNFPNVNAVSQLKNRAKQKLKQNNVRYYNYR